MDNRTLLIILVALAISMIGAPAIACIHAMSRSYTTAIAPTDLEAILAWDDGVEDLVVRLGYQSDDEGPETLAYVLPVRNVPSHYSAVDENVFEEMRAFVDLKRVYRPRAKKKSRSRSAASAKESSALQKMPAVAAGPFEIQPLKATGAAGLQELQKWMKKNGFAPIPAEDAQYYVDRNWTFLAIKLSPEAQQTSSGTIPALHVRFATERAVLPLKLLKMDKPISVTAYLLTRDNVSQEARRAIADQHQFESAGGRYSHVRAPANKRGALQVRHSSISVDSVPAAVQTLLKEIGWPSTTESSLLVLHSGLFGSDRVDPAKWTEELAIPPADDRLMGGDGEDGEDVPTAAPETPGAEEGGRPPTHTNGEGPRADDTEPVDTNPSGLVDCSVSGTSGPSALLLSLAVVFGWRMRRRNGGRA